MWLPWQYGAIFAVVLTATAVVLRRNGGARALAVAPFASETAIVLALYALWRYAGMGVVPTAMASAKWGDPACGCLNARLAALSARAMAGQGDNTLIVGFAISGTENKTLLIRGVGPTLTQYGVSGVLADPQLKLFNQQGQQLQENNDWGGGSALANAFTQTYAFALPAASKDAAMLVTLAPGIYTAQISGVGNTTGGALLEVYEVP